MERKKGISVLPDTLFTPNLSSMFTIILKPVGFAFLDVFVDVSTLILKNRVLRGPRGKNFLTLTASSVNETFHGQVFQNLFRFFNFSAEIFAIVSDKDLSTSISST